MTELGRTSGASRFSNIGTRGARSAISVEAPAGALPTTLGKSLEGIEDATLGGTARATIKMTTALRDHRLTHPDPTQRRRAREHQPEGELSETIHCHSGTVHLAAECVKVETLSTS
jgi:hypothetical protein